MRNVISVDVEDYFHPSEVQTTLGSKDWSNLPSRVEPATERILDIFGEANVQGTFFVLGWVAEHKPALLRRIAGAGHEIACHSYAHALVYDLTPEQFRADTVRAVKAIEDACGVTPKAYRAPSYSVTRASFWALDVLAGLGFTHDSSIYPIAHDRYGIPGFPRHAHRIETASGPIFEVPIATVRLNKRRVSPVGGGGYLRLLPYRYTAAGLRRVNNEEKQPACVYVHPWEVDPGQPRLARGFIARLRTYTGLGAMGRKLERLLREFEFAPMSAVYPVV